MDSHPEVPVTSKGYMYNELSKESHLRATGALKLEHLKIKEELRVVDATLTLRMGQSMTLLALHLMHNMPIDAVIGWAKACYCMHGT